jgi:hypothetical protein
MKVTVVTRAETFARLLVADPAAGGEPDKVEVAADWRAHDPVMLEIGPVLHADDAVANKMAALYGRALARDFLDVDAILASGRYTPERLLELAAAADAGFDQHLFASALGALSQITDAFTEYGISADDSDRPAAPLRQLARHSAHQLTASPRHDLAWPVQGRWPVIAIVPSERWLSVASDIQPAPRLELSFKCYLRA